MTTASIFVSVLVMGFTCSMGCGTVNTPFLLGSLLGDGGDVNQSKKAIMFFSLGKIISLMAMGLLTAVFGSLILSAVESMYPDATIWLIRIATCLFGFNILYATLKKEFFSQKVEKNPSSCGSSESSCGGCKSSCPSANKIPEVTEGKPNITYFLAGLLYATIPCGPLLTTLTYASTMNLLTATALLGLFGLVNSLIPVFFLASLVGLANTEFQKNSAQFLKYIRLSGGVILIYASIFQVY